MTAAQAKQIAEGSADAIRAAADSVFGPGAHFGPSGRAGADGRLPTGLCVPARPPGAVPTSSGATPLRRPRPGCRSGGAPTRPGGVRPSASHLVELAESHPVGSGALCAPPAGARSRPRRPPDHGNRCSRRRSRRAAGPPAQAVAPRPFQSCRVHRCRTVPPAPHGIPAVAVGGAAGHGPGAGAGVCREPRGPRSPDRAGPQNHPGADHLGRTPLPRRACRGVGVGAQRPRGRRVRGDRAPPAPRREPGRGSAHERPPSASSRAATPAGARQSRSQGDAPRGDLGPCDSAGIPRTIKGRAVVPRGRRT